MENGHHPTVENHNEHNQAETIPDHQLKEQPNVEPTDNAKVNIILDIIKGVVVESESTKHSRTHEEAVTSTEHDEDSHESKRPKLSNDVPDKGRSTNDDGVIVNGDTTVPAPAPKNKNDPKQKPKSKSNRHKVDPTVYQFRHTVGMCCKRNDLRTAMEAHRRVSQDGIRVEAQSYHNLISLCVGLGGGNGSGSGSGSGSGGRNVSGGRNRNGRIHAGTPRESKATEPTTTNDGAADNDPMKSAPPPPLPPPTYMERRAFADQLRADMERDGVAWNETSYTALLRFHCGEDGATDDNNAAAVQTLLDAVEALPVDKGPRLRTYAPVLGYYCRNQDVAGFLKTWERLDQPPRCLSLTEAELVWALRVATAADDAEVFRQVLSRLADVVAVPSRETTEAVSAWYGRPHTDSSQQQSLWSTITLRKDEGLAVMDRAVVMGDKFEVSSVCRFDATTGRLLDGCLEGRTLMPCPMLPSYYSRMMRMTETIVQEGSLEAHTSRYQGGRKGPKKNFRTEEDPTLRRRRLWASFKRWMDHRVGPPAFPYEDETMPTEPPTTTSSSSSSSSVVTPPDKSDNLDTKKIPFDVVLDGANIGYYQKGLKKAVTEADDNKFCHKRYIPVDYRQIDAVVQEALSQPQCRRVLVVLHERHVAPRNLPPWARPLVDKWNEPAKDATVALYRTPFGCDDDWFWYHAALWCGPDCRVVTNDEMRDHHFQRLSEDVFLKWKERHRVTFDFDYHLGQQRQRRARLHGPPVYSRRIQAVPSPSKQEGLGLAVPLPRRGDPDRFLDGTHVAGDEEPEEETYLCVRPLASLVDHQKKDVDVNVANGKGAFVEGETPQPMTTEETEPSTPVPVPAPTPASAS